MEKTENMKNKVFRFLVVIYLLVNAFKFANAQEYTGLAGYLTVDNNVWTLKFQDNNTYDKLVYDVLGITDISELKFDSKNDVEQFYNDLSTAVNTKEGEIVGKNYTLIITKKSVIVVNQANKFTIVTKKYSKPGLTAIQESISYMI